MLTVHQWAQLFKDMRSRVQKARLKPMQPASSRTRTTSSSLNLFSPPARSSTRSSAVHRGYDAPEEARRARTPRARLFISTSVEPMSPLPSEQPPVFTTDPMPHAIGEFLSQCRLVVWDFDQTVLRIHSYAAKIRADMVQHRSVAVDFADLEFFVGLVKFLVHHGINVAIASFGKYDVIQMYLDCAFGRKASQNMSFRSPRKGRRLSGQSPQDATTSPSSATVSIFSPRSWKHTTPLKPSLLGPRGGGAGAGTGASGGGGADGGVSGADMPAPPTSPPPPCRLSPSGPFFTRTNIVTPSLVGGRDGSSLRDGKSRQLELLCEWAGVTREQTVFFDDDLKNVEMARDDGYLRSVCTPHGFTRDTWAAFMKGWHDCS